MLSELFERLDSISLYKPQVHYYHGQPGSGHESFVYDLFPDAFKYNSRSRLEEKRWKNYDNQKVIIANVDEDVHLKILLIDLILRERVPFHIVIVSSKSPELLEKEEKNLSEENEIDEFVCTNKCQQPEIFFKRYVGDDDIETLGSEDGIISVRIKDTKRVLDIFREDELVKYSLDHNINMVIF
jgi:hypothetical protein